MRGIELELERTIEKEKKMAFIAGPRQVGKTTLAQFLLKKTSSEKGYFNWDIDTHRLQILKDRVHFWKQGFQKNPKRVVLDEIHKYLRWKKFLKGFFDANRHDLEILVTGSGRLDVYQRGGDSLMGRYHLYHLFPLTVGELVYETGALRSATESVTKLFDTPVDVTSHFNQLWHTNGFPEPFYASETRVLNRWQNDHRQLILREDLRDLTQIRELGLVEALMTLLPERIGSPLSINALREDLNVNFKTAQNWLQTLERLYYLFFLKPYSARLARTLRREEKVYFYDWAEVENEGGRLENLVAVHLHKAVNLWTDAGYGRYSLHYVRDKEKREVDFLICEKNKPYVLIEVKQSNREISPALIYYHERLKPQHSFQIISEVPSDFLSKQQKDIYLCSVPRFLSVLP